MNIYRIIILAAAFAAIGMIAGSISVQSEPVHSVAMPSTASFDIHDINAQIFGNKNATEGILSYLTNQSPSGVLPSSLIITARSPGNSTLTLVLNGSYVRNSVGIPMHNLAFVGISTQYFTAPVANETFVITVHSNEMNYTRTFRYDGNVKTPQEFITYETSKRVPTPPTALLNGFEGYLIFGATSAASVTSCLFIVMYVKWQSHKHVNGDDFLIDKVK